MNLLHLLHSVFYHLRDTGENGPPALLTIAGGTISGRQVCLSVSVVVSVSVETAMECQMRDNVVFCARFDTRAQPLQPPLRRRLRQPQRVRDLLAAHASDCHLFNGVHFLCGKDHSRCEHAHKHLGIEPHVAVVY